MDPTPADATPSWKVRWLPAVVPFAFSLALSLSTVGAHAFWQDSGFYLTAVHELGVLYPPGFPLYLVLCKLWTKVLFFVDFTLAVHLFSSFCAALAAAGLGSAARELLRSRGPLFRTTAGGEASSATMIGCIVGCCAATGYTFWFTALYAKGYSFLYMILAALLWRMIRADSTARARDFTIVAALIGLAWQAHPSAALGGPAFLLFVAVHRKSLPPRLLGRCVLIAAAAALGPSLLLLPLLAGRNPSFSMGDPTGPGGFVSYLVGTRYVAKEGSFGLDAERATLLSQYLWEELLGVGLALVALGASRLATGNRRLLGWLAAWILPWTFVTLLFRIEGQHDCWCVAAWMPLHLLAALGLQFLATRWGAKGRWIPVAAGAALVAWAVALNAPLLNQRSYTLAEDYGRIYFSALPSDAVVLLESDDSIALSFHLQKVRHENPGVAIVQQPYFQGNPAAGPNWYEKRLLQDHPMLKVPDLAGLDTRLDPTLAIGAFVQANAACGRPLFFDIPPAPRMIPRGSSVVPAGVLWTLVPDSQRNIDLRYWKFPIQPEEVAGRMRRERGIRRYPWQGRIVQKPEAYEHRLLLLLLRARHSLADVYESLGEHRKSIPLYESIRHLEPELEETTDVLWSLGRAYRAVGDDARAEPILRAACRVNLGPEALASCLLLLGECLESQGRRPEARQAFQAVLRVPGAPAPIVEKARAKAGSP